MRTHAGKLGLPVLQQTGAFLSPQDYVTENGVVLPAPIVRAMISRYNDPVVAPADLVPDSAYERMGGRVLHLPSPRQKAPATPADGKCCDFCAFFRYDEGQAMIRSRPTVRDGLVSLGSRAPFVEDMGLCANDNVSDGNMLIGRFAGSDCPYWAEAGSVLSSVDSKRGRRLDWEGR